MHKGRESVEMERCVLVRKGIVKYKGKPTIEFYKDGKPQYYCYGYMDLMTDEPFEECVNCKKWVYGEQCEKDYEEEIARRKEMGCE